MCKIENRTTLGSENDMITAMPTLYYGEINLLIIRRDCLTTTILRKQRTTSPSNSVPFCRNVK